MSTMRSGPSTGLPEHPTDHTRSSRATSRGCQPPNEETGMAPVGGTGSTGLFHLLNTAATRSMSLPAVLVTTRVELSGRKGAVVDTKSVDVATLPGDPEPAGLPAMATASFPAIKVAPATRRFGSSGTNCSMASVGPRVLATRSNSESPFTREIHFPAYSVAVLVGRSNAPSRMEAIA